jgi:hypothetical protein
VKKRIITLIITPLLLLGCKKTPNLSSIKILSPAGAPSLSLYSFANEENFETNSNVSIIQAKFLTSEYDVIIMDHKRGIAQITENNAKFKLARIVTKGNLYLVGINKAETDVPKDSDTVISFGSPTAITNQILTNIYPEITNLFYVNSVTDAGSVLKQGKYNNEAVDYVMLAEPLLSTILNEQEDYPSKDKLTRIISLQDEWESKTGFDGYPQAGIFVSDNFIAKSNLYNEFFANFDENVNNLINNSEVVISFLNEYGDLNKQKARFGANSKIISLTQGNNENRLGFTLGGVNINAFNEYMGLQAFDEGVFAPNYL